MPRRIRHLMLAGVVCLLAFGSVGDSQTPGGTGPGTTLRSTEDVDALHCVLTYLLQSGQPRADSLVFHHMVTGVAEKVFRGRLLFYPNGARSQSLQEVELVFLHSIGLPCSIPPDQLFCVHAPASSALVTGPQDKTEFEFMLEVLSLLSRKNSRGPVTALADWFDSSLQIVLVNIETSHSGNRYTCELQFEDHTAIPSLVWKYAVSAVHNSAGFERVVVR